MSGPERIAIRLVDGTSMRLPRQWTDADGSDLHRDGREEYDFFFTVDSLRRVIDLLESFLSR